MRILAQDRLISNNTRTTKLNNNDLIIGPTGAGKTRSYGEVYARVMREHLDSDTAFDIDVMCDLPDGVISFQEIRRVLEEIEFHGIGIVESDMPRATNAQAFASAKRNLTYLREVGIIA